jgi:3-deoxy-D-manno-octulosonic-acid transferase
MSPFNKKVKKGLKDRKRLFENIIIELHGLNRRKKMVWFHSSSMGEFEQAKPIIQKLKQTQDVNVIVTFFSPSGYENSLRYPYADIVSYIPFDTVGLSKKFLELTKPELAVFMRYDIWPNFIFQLSSKKIPSLLVDATMRAESKRKLPFVKGFHKGLYKRITKILTVSDNDRANFLDFDLDENQVTKIGDTRFDRVYQKSLQAKAKKLFKDNFFEGKKVFVFGSSWEADEDAVLPAFLKMTRYDPKVIMIIAPHEPTLLRLQKIEEYLSTQTKSIRFSYLNSYDNENVIIIDSIGILLTLYYYADVAYVGGSFKQGIHNVLEPAVYGIPVIYGPKIENSREAKKLVELGGSQVVLNKKQAYRALRTLFSEETKRKEMGKVCYDYVAGNVGATDKILSEINNYI